MYALPILAALAIISGFMFGQRQFNVLVNILMMTVFVVVGFLGFALNRWGLSYALWMVFVSCVLGQTSYVLGVSFSRA